jgi:hypothetical protein
MALLLHTTDDVNLTVAFEPCCEPALDASSGSPVCEACGWLEEDHAVRRDRFFAGALAGASSAASS